MVVGVVRNRFSHANHSISDARLSISLANGQMGLSDIFEAAGRTGHITNTLYIIIDTNGQLLVTCIKRNRKFKKFDVIYVWQVS